MGGLLLGPTFSPIKKRWKGRETECFRTERHDEFFRELGLVLAEMGVGNDRNASKTAGDLEATRKNLVYMLFHFLLLRIRQDRTSESEEFL